MLIKNSEVVELFQQTTHLHYNNRCLHNQLFRKYQMKTIKTQLVVTKQKILERFYVKITKIKMAKNLKLELKPTFNAEGVNSKQPLKSFPLKI